MKVNKNRLSESFKFLVEIDSESKDEASICRELKKILEEMGAETIVDNAGEKVGSNTGNLIARFKGNVNVEPLLFNAHMDTVKPGKGVKALLKNDIFTSKGKTILGADDKSAIAVLLETINVIKEHNVPHGPIELVFTICEEIGLLGAKHLDFSLISSKIGYVLDTSNTESIVTRAPSSNKMVFKVYGKDAHSGIDPEKGINAIHIASKAIANLNMGRIDEETSANIGVIEGGKASNIVPNFVRIEGEVRSHNESKLMKVTNEIVTTFKKTIEESQKAISNDSLPSVEIDINKDFSSTNIPHDHHVVTLARKAGENLNRKILPSVTGGGADANIFFEKGIITGVLGTGMCEMHTSREYVKLDDLVKTAELVLEIVILHAGN